ncbi:MAG: hypothetical protein LBS08_05875 [Candidatus Symbiothrix sp.]|jgi:hypothetical protein|nr:hypothetical protein [Candidatus Symbiothrix sp.]
MKKVKFEDLSFDKEKLKLVELAALEGGRAIEFMNSTLSRDGCSSGVCENIREIGAGYCEDAVCTSGIGVCTGKTA